MAFHRFLWRRFATACVLTVSLCPQLTLAKNKKDAVQYGAGLIVNVPYPEADVLKVVQDVVDNGIIRGTKEYAKDEYVKGALPAKQSNVFPAWTEGGKVFYKVRAHALDPRNFKDSNDVGTLAVRYIVIPQDDKHTVLKVDALFVEEFKHTVHASDGTVEGAEYKDIHDRLEATDLVKQQTAEAVRQKEQAAQEAFAKESKSTPVENSAPPLPAATSPETAGASSDSLSLEDLQHRVKELRSQTQRKVRAPGAALRTAPFRTATNLQSLSTGTEVLIVISTPYWYGVETHDGQHGWIMRDELEEMQ